MRLFGTVQKYSIRNLLILLILVVFIAVPGHGEESVTLDEVTGTNYINQLNVEEDISFRIRFTNTSGSNIISFYNGFRIYSEDGAVWQNSDAIITSLSYSNFSDVAINPLNIDGILADTIGFSADQGSFPTGFDEVVLHINIGPLDIFQFGKTICLDTAFIPPDHNWSWSILGGEIIPDWDGPHCFEIACALTVDSDNDQIGDECDNCPFHSNPYQEDNDNDGYGNVCDCNPNDSLINPETIWYVDADGDGWGDINSTTIVQCLQPDGYVINAKDCDDSDPNIGAPKIWYLDNDSDGYGDDSFSIESCNIEPGYSLVGGDCDDSDSLINPETIWYYDSDLDGYGDPEIDSVSCVMVSGYVTNFDDCDDSDSLINPETVWYYDSDLDGYGDTGIDSVSCVMVSGYVTNFDDCDDSDSLINPETVWYEDLDEDGFGDNEVQFTGCVPPAKYVIQGNDNCVEFYNPDQADTNSNGIGDICELQTGFAEDESRTLPEKFALFQNYPNPFNSETIISFNIPYQTEGDLAIYNLLGERVYIISEGWLKPGRFHFSWNGQDENNKNLPSGVYFYRLNTSDITLSKKMIYLK